MMEKMRTTPHVRLWMALILLALSPAGCRYDDVDGFVPSPSQVVARTPYTVAPPDTLTILAPQVPEINQATPTVHPDGKIYLPLVGAIFVAGMTQEQIAAILESKAGQFYKDAKVIVQISGYRSKHVYVFGHVTAPGPYPYTGSDSVLGILSRAQPTRLADTNRIQVFRPGPDGKQVSRMTVEVDKWIETGRLDRNVLLADGDIIYVPPTGLARVGLTLQELLLPIQPAANVISGPGEIDQDIQRSPYSKSGAGGGAGQ